ncbi:uncharacterized protein PHALS_06499 [Plasmopara halstedii]|uniref:Uncharacterized protein n=1 Tax=Plasmopara halstedii TaxID=4781 RepID=A0A0P1B2K9_PLAHL|nr:uncharacterized protein PHALS_06499 [Plasmopara halstedii]CEG48688.1 hypothetical protein PHALS_06499 [Plasmopara halstedii]|eukprot:XP_024585057.1 hypothetical protein PHALS_06499 [Plasmopara halstedii]
MRVSAKVKVRGTSKRIFRNSSRNSKDSLPPINDVAQMERQSFSLHSNVVIEGKCMDAVWLCSYQVTTLLRRVN